MRGSEVDGGECEHDAAGQPCRGIEPGDGDDQRRDEHHDGDAKPNGVALFVDGVSAGFGPGVCVDHVQHTIGAVNEPRAAKE